MESEASVPSAVRSGKSWGRMLLASNLVLISLWAWNLPWSRFAAGEGDFLQFYAGGRFAGTSRLYDPEAHREFQRQQVGKILPAVTFNIRMPWYAALYRPLTALPYLTAQRVFVLLGIAAFAGFAWCYRKEAPEIVWLAFCPVPMLISAVNGQDTSILLAVLGTFLWALRYKRDYLAGAALALCTVKPHFFLFVPFALVALRWWKVLAVATSGVLLLLLISTQIQGADWVSGYWRNVIDPRINETGFNPNLFGVAAALRRPALEWILGAAAVLSIAILAWLNGDARTLLASSLVAGLLTSHHAYIQDCMLLYAALVTFAPGSWQRRSLMLLLTPLPFFLLLVEGPVSAIYALALLGVVTGSAWESLRARGSGLDGRTRLGRPPPNPAPLAQARLRA